MTTKNALANRSTGGRVGVCALPSVLIVAAVCSAAQADHRKPMVDISVVEDTGDRIVLQYAFGDFHQSSVSIDGAKLASIGLGEEGQILRAGCPNLPRVCRSVIIPDDGSMSANVLSSESYEIMDIDVAPSKGNLSRQVDPTSIPYTFGVVYTIDQDYPGRLVSLGEPYTLRDHRGVVVRVNPFQYNPVRRKLRVYTNIVLEVVNTGPGVLNVPARPAREKQLSLAFHQLYKSHFLNYRVEERYAPLDEVGELLIVCHDAWLPNLQPLVDHKNSIGIGTTLVGVSTAGTSSTAIRNYVQDVYDTSELAFLLLVGDAAQVATPYASGGSSDPSYALLAGADHYPDILVGRFSAENAGQVDTQVRRTIDYENLPATLQPWFKKGVGIGSSEGAGIGDDGESDTQHIENIRSDLLAYDYAHVDGLYGAGASASQVTSALNAGRGIINYCGHGSTYSWGTTGFDTADVAALTNDNMLPFIVSVACVNGQFAGYTCFAEAWLRATHGSEPTGAIGMYASSVNQSWAPPMSAQDETVDLLVAEAYFSFGALCFAGSCRMMDEYGYDGMEMYDTWHVFGDPSVRVFGTAAPPTGLKVTPSHGLTSEGQRGGPFVPDAITYTLENLNGTEIGFSVTHGRSWISVDNPVGLLAPYAATTVTVSINDEAASLGNGHYEDTIEFINTTDHDGDTTRAVSLDVGVPTLQYRWTFDSDPGWSTQGLWAFGRPTGRGGQYGGPDPSGGHTGNNVYGYNLAGDYENYLPQRHLTTNAIDCSGLTHVSLGFWRWLGVEQPAYDHAYLAVSNDGSNWVTVWQNGAEITDYSWVLQEFDVSEVADNQPTLYVRWTMGTTDASWQYCGWNIDDVEIWGLAADEAIPGDLDGDGDVDLTDLATLLAHYGETSGVGYEDGDIDGDGDVDLADLAVLLASYV